MNANNSEVYKWTIENAKEMIEHYKKVIESAEIEIKKSEWMYGKDKMELVSSHRNEKLTISSNLRNWIDAKTAERSFVLFIEGNGEGVIGLTTEQAKQLRDYLNQKIEYLES